jgi:hypothetical protein
MKLSLTVLILILLSACSTISNYNSDREINFSKIIKYSSENGCTSAKLSCTKKNITFFVNSTAVIIKKKDVGRILHFKNSEIIQFTEDNFENKTFFFNKILRKTNIESLDLEKREKYLQDRKELEENNKNILYIIDQLNSLI